MYILIELVPEVDGSGLVFVCILLIVLALLIGAELSMSWILAPIGLTMALMESANWWILLLAAGIGIVANWVRCFGSLRNYWGTHESERYKRMGNSVNTRVRHSCLWILLLPNYQCFNGIYFYYNNSMRLQTFCRGALFYGKRCIIRYCTARAGGRRAELVWRINVP